MLLFIFFLFRLLRNLLDLHHLLLRSRYRRHHLLLSFSCCQFSFLLCSYRSLLRLLNLSKSLLFSTFTLFLLALTDFFEFHSLHFKCRYLLLIFLILLFCPWFDFVVLAFDVFISQILQNTLTASGDDRASNRLQRITIHLNILQLLMFSKEIWQTLDVVVE